MNEALRAGPSFFAISAAVAALHARAERAETTDWRQIAALYAILDQSWPSPLVTLNRAVAVAMTESVERALEFVAAANSDGALDEYHLFHAARGDLLRRSARYEDALAAYERALACTRNEAERDFLRRRREEMRALSARPS